MDLGRCVSILTNAGSDNEKMAALLLAAKLIRSSDIGAEGRRKVFDAVGFNFLNRLLATKSIPEGCAENPYHKIALTILACFCTDHELVVHPQVTTKIPLFNEFLLQRSADQEHSSGGDRTESIPEDALQCLQGISSSCSGLKHLLRPGHCTLETLAKCYLGQSKVSDEARDFLLYIVGHVEARAVDTFSSSLSACLVILVSEFKTNQNELKFKLCEVLHKMLMQCGDALDPVVLGGGWVGDIALGLKDILTSKLDSSHRNPSLHLAATLCHLLGLEWAAAVGSQFLVLLVDLFNVETRLAVDGKELQEITQSSHLLCSCFVVMETTIVFVSRQTDMKQTEGVFSLSREDLLHLHSTLTESFTYITLLLNKLEGFISHQATPHSPQVDDDSSNTQESSSTHTSKEQPAAELLRSLLIACVRVIGAWLTEDSLSLSSEVLSCLPFLIQLAKSTDNVMAESKGEDILKFILPGLSHLTAEDKPRKILLKAEILSLLFGHMQRLVDSGPLSLEMAGRVRLCCEILVNVCICEPGLVKEDEMVGSNAGLILKIFLEAPDGCNVLKMNALLLLILITNKKGPDLSSKHIIETPMSQVWNSVFQYLLSCLRECPCVSSTAKKTSISGAELKTASTSEVWEDISELWFIAMQELSLLAKFDREFVQVMAQGDLIKQLANVLANITQLSKGNEQLESITTVVCTFLQTVTPNIDTSS